MNNPNIRISVKPRFIVEQSNPDAGKYFFSYTIRVVNEDSQTYQLISRQWLITDGDGNEQRVIGEGVVGKQPIIAAGESFSYTSGVLLDSPVGTMEGSYTMVNAHKESVEAVIEPFLLAYPGAVN
jgi:ApaG protein